MTFEWPSWVHPLPIPFPELHNKKLLLDDEENKVDKCFTNSLDVYKNESGFDPEEETLRVNKIPRQGCPQHLVNPREGTRCKIDLKRYLLLYAIQYYDSNSVFYL